MILPGEKQHEAAGVQRAQAASNWLVTVATSSLSGQNGHLAL
jgi:hypothetical protein